MICDVTPYCRYSCVMISDVTPYCRYSCVMISDVTPYCRYSEAECTPCVMIMNDKWCLTELVTWPSSYWVLVNNNLFNSKIGKHVAPTCNVKFIYNLQQIGMTVLQGFQYFSCVPVLHYLHIHFHKIWTFCMSILFNTLWNYQVPITILSV